MHYCALCCIAKDEDLFLKEWLAYHALIGFEHFFIYDNLSATPISAFLDGWALPTDVTVIRNAEPSSQWQVYDHCLEHFGARCQWIAFLDLDEFIRLSPPYGGAEPEDIRPFLAEFEPYAGIGLNWRMFSSAGHEKTPKGPVIANYTRCLGDDPHIKSIVQPSKVTRCAGPHSFHPVPGAHAVNAGHFPIPPAFPGTTPATDRIAVHHYFYKSRECFAAKIAKGNPCNIERRMQEFEAHLSLPDSEDASLQPLVPALRQGLRAGRFTPAMPPALMPGKEDSLPLAHKLIHDDGSAAALRGALLHLCYVMMYNRADNAPDPLLSMSVWQLRAMAARKLGQPALAEWFLRQVFQLGPDRQAYAELAALLAQQGRMAEAKQTLAIMRIFQDGNI